MKLYIADMHIHSALSPCGNAEMNAYDIVTVAMQRGLNIIALTDHNCTKQVQIVKDFGKQEGILVIPGLEVNTKEEIHCLVYFETVSQLEEFQKYLDKHMPRVKNKATLFGKQVISDLNGDILDEVDELLLVGLDTSFNQVARMVHSMDGIIVPAHIDKSRNSILSQLGFIPSGATIDAVEIFNPGDYERLLTSHPELSRWSVMSNSDAHFLKDIGSRTTFFNLAEPSFEEIRMAMHK